MCTAPSARVFSPPFGFLSRFSQLTRPSSPGKHWCFQQIKAKIPADARVVVVGDSEEEQLAASKMKWDFFSIHSKGDLQKLYHKYLEE